ncbi:MAG: VCBS repeat-containing protein [Bacteroidetes bacterium]|nr:VCBS repeat-containing protein [Bacteroidota bacterium]
MNPNQLDVEQLARAYCSACHLFPEPSLLPKTIWKEGVLPHMGYRLGINKGKNSIWSELSVEEALILRSGNIFPSEPLISEEAWKKIEDYYLTNAPDQPFPPASKTDLIPQMDQFKSLSPQFSTALPPLITLLEFDSVSSLLFIGDAENTLSVVDPNLQVINQFSLDSPPSFMQIVEGEIWVLTMGIMNPSDRSIGKLVQMGSPWKVESRGIFIRLDNLPRPVFAQFADLNGDHKEDIIICGFGNYLGKLAWYENLGDNKYQEKVLKNLPGALKSYVRDINKDGNMDIIVLMGQGDEGIFIFYGLGEGEFREEAVLRFHPLYGSMHFELVDFNRDGWLDILYANGDNGDYSVSLKSYHGVRIYLNDQTNHFEQAYFYPMHGAIKAMARDFDQDGDIDIAAIAFFPDYQNLPHEGFVYLENLGNLTFKNYTFPEAIDGRWLVMEVGDVDGDLDDDLILGSFIYGVTPVPDDIHSKWQENSQPVIILENQLN